MSPSSNTIRIAILNADIPVPNVLASSGTYGAIFNNLLVAAAERVAPHINIVTEEYDVVLGAYPPNVAHFDALVVTGSAASTYDKADWIARLSAFLRHVYETLPRIKIFGSCFGHQVLCQSLLEPYGARVERNPKGWEIGVHEVHLSDSFSRALGGRRSLRMQFVHADHVTIPSSVALPRSWMSIGSTDRCAIQGVYEPGRVFTFQGHFEFDRFINSETVKVFGALWQPYVLQEALKAIDAHDDAEVAADIVIDFFRNDLSSTREASRPIELFTYTGIPVNVVV